MLKRLVSVKRALLGLWDQIRGNAKWDLIKWALIGSPAAVAALLWQARAWLLQPVARYWVVVALFVGLGVAALFALYRERQPFGINAADEKLLNELLRINDWTPDVALLGLLQGSPPLLTLQLRKLERKKLISRSFLQGHYVSHISAGGQDYLIKRLQ